MQIEKRDLLANGLDSFDQLASHGRPLRAFHDFLPIYFPPLSPDEDEDPPAGV